jgi:hypothetical protein
MNQPIDAIHAPLPATESYDPFVLEALDNPYGPPEEMNGGSSRPDPDTLLEQDDNF